MLRLGLEFKDSVGVGLGLGFRDWFRVRIRFCLVDWVNPGQGDLDVSR